MSTKKKPSGSRPASVEGKVTIKVKVKVETPGTTQPAAERKAAEAELRTLITKFATPHVRLVAAVRKSLQKLLPTAHEVVYEYRDFVVISLSPSGHGHEGVLAIHASASGVKLYFNSGKQLPDPEKLLQGSAKLVRWIDLVGASTLTRPAVASLIGEAIARNPVPFASVGRGGGSVVIRSTAAQKRRGSG
jgi:hypothetical protein